MGTVLASKPVKFDFQSQYFMLEIILIHVVNTIYWLLQLFSNWVLFLLNHDQIPHVQSKEIFFLLQFFGNNLHLVGCVFNRVRQKWGHTKVPSHMYDSFSCTCQNWLTTFDKIRTMHCDETLVTQCYNSAILIRKPKNDQVYILQSLCAEFFFTSKTQQS